MSPSPKDAGSYLSRDFAPIADQVEWNLLEGVAEVAPGVSVLPCRGHTMGMQLVRVRAGGRTLLHGADLFPTRWHLRPTWNMAYDNDPLVTVQEKRWWLSVAVEQGWVFLLEHDADVPAVRPTDAKGGFEVVGF